MGGGSSKPASADPNAGKSTNIDLQLIDQQLDDLFKFKILLLGAGESGKSTVVKQLKLIHKKNVSAKELKLVGNSLHQNVVDWSQRQAHSSGVGGLMRSLITAARSFGYTDFDDDELKTEELLNEHDESERISPELGERIAKLFHSNTIQKTFDRRAEFWLLDSFPYYVKNLVRFCEADFTPTEEDSLMARIRTTGIVNSELEQKVEKVDEAEPDTIKFQVVDVGGQRNERKKWMHCFDDVRAILFIVNLAGFNQVLFEDSAKNRMYEELELFEQITHNQLFASVPIFLFLNKKDLFEQMVSEIDMKKTFAEYSGGKSMDPALSYVMEQFRRKLPPGKTVSIHPVSARWKKDIRAAFEDVKKTLYDGNRDDLLKQAKVIRAQKKTVAQEKKGGGGCF